MAETKDQELLARKVLGLVGLGARARNVIVGVDRVKEGARRGKVKMALVAHDASHNSRDKVLPLLLARRIGVWEGLTAAALGNAVGRDTTAVVGITDAALAAGVKRLVFATTTPVTGKGPGRTR